MEKGLELYYLYIKETKNNIFFTLSSKSKSTVLSTSSGQIKLKGPLRKTPNTASRLASYMCKEMELRRVNSLQITVEGHFTNIKKVILRKLGKLSHNGVRKKKQRRL